MLSIKNAHIRDTNIQFEADGHKYTVNGQKDFISVTTFIHDLFSAFNSAVVINSIIRSKKHQNDADYKYYKKSADEIQAEWDETAKLASDAGTDMHAVIEHFYNGNKTTSEIVEICGVEYRYFMEFVSAFPNLRPYRTEWFIYEEDYKIAGSVDMVFVDDNTGDFYIYDWKRSKGLVYDDSYNKTSILPALRHVPDCNYWHYCLQLNLYKRVLETKYGLQIKGMFLVVLHPNNISGTFERVEVQNMSAEIDIVLQKRSNDVIHSETETATTTAEIETNGNKNENINTHIKRIKLTV